MGESIERWLIEVAIVAMLCMALGLAGAVASIGSLAVVLFLVGALAAIVL